MTLYASAFRYADGVWCRVFGEHLPHGYAKESDADLVIKAYMAGFRAGEKLPRKKVKE